MNIKMKDRNVKQGRQVGEWREHRKLNMVDVLKYLYENRTVQPC
jgi:hypothetical protein